MDVKELEQTLVLIKPDALKNSLTGYLLSQLAEFHTGLHFAGAKIVHVPKMLAEVHYAEHKGKGFYPALLDYIMGHLHYGDDPWKQRVVAIVYQGPNAIKRIRDFAGPTNPHDARIEKPGCIRALGTLVPVKDDSGIVLVALVLLMLVISVIGTSLIFTVSKEAKYTVKDKDSNSERYSFTALASNSSFSTTREFSLKLTCFAFIVTSPANTDTPTAAGVPIVCERNYLFITES